MEFVFCLQTFQWQCSFQERFYNWKLFKISSVLGHGLAFFLKVISPLDKVKTLSILFKCLQAIIILHNFMKKLSVIKQVVEVLLERKALL